MVWYSKTCLQGILWWEDTWEQYPIFPIFGHLWWTEAFYNGGIFSRRCALKTGLDVVLEPCGIQIILLFVTLLTSKWIMEGTAKSKPHLCSCTRDTMVHDVLLCLISHATLCNSWYYAPAIDHLSCNTTQISQRFILHYNKWSLEAHCHLKKLVFFL